jgi:hypothetical protein
MRGRDSRASRPSIPALSRSSAASGISTPGRRASWPMGSMFSFSDAAANCSSVASAIIACMSAGPTTGCANQSPTAYSRASGSGWSTSPPRAKSTELKTSVEEGELKAARAGIDPPTVLHRIPIGERAAIEVSSTSMDSPGSRCADAERTTTIKADPRRLERDLRRPAGAGRAAAGARRPRRTETGRAVDSTGRAGRGLASPQAARLEAGHRPARGPREGPDDLAPGPARGKAEAPRSQCSQGIAGRRRWR